MRSIYKRRFLFVCGAVFFISFSVQASDDRSEEKPKMNLAPIQLVQSVPVGTDLAQVDLPMTEDVWIDMIRRAKVSIDLAQFFLSVEPKTLQGKKLEKRPLDEVIRELEKATTRGVRLRLLVSQSLVTEDPQTLDRFKKMRNTVVRICDMSEVSGGVLHAKYWIIDGKEIFLGSQNFDWRSLNQIHELGVRVDDVEVARQLSRVFEVDWKVAKTGKTPPTLPGLLPDLSTPRMVELVASPQILNPPEIRSSIDALVSLINEAKRSIRVQLLDYSPVTQSQHYWPELDVALRAAALRSVKIQMMISSSPTALRAVDYLKSLSILPGVEVKLVTVPPLEGVVIPYARMIHSKYMILDDQAFWIGTSNWSKGYFYNSRNVELIFRRLDLAQIGVRIFQKLWDSKYSEKVDVNKIYNTLGKN